MNVNLKEKFWEKMITQTNVQGPESNSSDVIKDMSPQTNIQTPSFEDDEFDIPQVNNFSILWTKNIWSRKIMFKKSFFHHRANINILFDDFIPEHVKTKV